MTLMKSLRDWRQARRTTTMLNRLDDRVLHDAGIARWRIREIARGAAVNPDDVV